MQLKYYIINFHGLIKFSYLDRLTIYIAIFILLFVHNLANINIILFIIYTYILFNIVLDLESEK